ncbi:MAG: DNA-processing protein DprA [Bacteroidales bacterium]|nr:DNA-processing protein DprA [Bacteroidales bacterium]
MANIKKIIDLKENELHGIAKDYSDAVSEALEWVRDDSLTEDGRAFEITYAGSTIATVRRNSKEGDVILAQNHELIRAMGAIPFQAHGVFVNTLVKDSGTTGNIVSIEELSQDAYDAAVIHAREEFRRRGMPQSICFNGTMLASFRMNSMEHMDKTDERFDRSYLSECHDLLEKVGIRPKIARDERLEGSHVETIIMTNLTQQDFEMARIAAFHHLEHNVDTEVRYNGMVVMSCDVFYDTEGEGPVWSPIIWYNKEVLDNAGIDYSRERFAESAVLKDFEARRRSLSTKATMYMLDKLRNAGLPVRLVSQSTARKLVSAQPERTELSVAELARLNYTWNGEDISLESFANTFSQQIKQRDRTVKDAERIAREYIKAVQEDPESFIAQLLPENMSHYRYFFLEDGSVFSRTNPLYNSPEYETQRGLLLIYERVLGEEGLDEYLNLLSSKDSLSGQDRARFNAMERKVSGSSLMQDHLEVNASAVNSQRSADIRSFIQYLSSSDDYSVIEKALLVKGAVTWGFIEKRSEGRVTVNAVKITDANDIPVMVLGGEAAAVVESLRHGKKFKDAVIEARSKLSGTKRSVPGNFTGWKRYPKSDREEDAVLLQKDAAGTGWCTGSAVSTARSHLSGGDFHIYFRDGEPLIAIRTQGGRMAEPPRGAHDGQFCTEEEERIAFDYVKAGNGIIAGDDYILDIEDIRRITSPDATWEDAIRMPAKRRYANGEFGGDTRSWGEEITKKREELITKAGTERIAKGYYFVDEIPGISIVRKSGDKNGGYYLLDMDADLSSVRFILDYPTVYGKAKESGDGAEAVPSQILHIKDNVSAPVLKELHVAAVIEGGSVFTAPEMETARDMRIGKGSFVSVGAKNMGNISLEEGASVRMDNLERASYIFLSGGQELSLPKLKELRRGLVIGCKAKVTASVLKKAEFINVRERGKLTANLLEEVGKMRADYDVSISTQKLRRIRQATVRTRKPSQWEVPSLEFVGILHVRRSANWSATEVERVGEIRIRRGASVLLDGVKEFCILYMEDGSRLSMRSLDAAVMKERERLNHVYTETGSVITTNAPASQVLKSSPTPRNTLNGVISDAVAMSTSDGRIYGFARKDGLYLTPDGINPNTPLHEYAHLWAECMMRIEPERWASLKAELKGNPEWETVVSSPSYAHLGTDEDRIAGEVLARVCGGKHEDIIMDIAGEVLADGPGPWLVDKEPVEETVRRYREMLAGFAVRDVFKDSDSPVTAEVTLAVLRDFAEGKVVKIYETGYSSLSIGDDDKNTKETTIEKEIVMEPESYKPAMPNIDLSQPTPDVSDAVSYATDAFIKSQVKGTPNAAVSDAYRQSVIQSVILAVSYINGGASAEFLDEQITDIESMTREVAEMLHDFWAARVMSAGVKYGPDKVPGKTHPELLPYGETSETHKAVYEGLARAAVMGVNQVIKENQDYALQEEAVAEKEKEAIRRTRRETAVIEYFVGERPEAQKLILEMAAAREEVSKEQSKEIVEALYKMNLIRPENILKMKEIFRGLDPSVRESVIDEYRTNVSEVLIDVEAVKKTMESIKESVEPVEELLIPKRNRKGESVWAAVARVAGKEGGVSMLSVNGTNHHFASPFATKMYGRVRMENIKSSVKESVRAFEQWLTGAAYTDVEPNRRKWIVGKILSGELYGKPLVYPTTLIDTPSGYRNEKYYNPVTAPNHAHILMKYINNPELLAMAINDGIRERAAREAGLAAPVPMAEMERWFSSLSLEQKRDLMLSDDTEFPSEEDSTPDFDKAFDTIEALKRDKSWWEGRTEAQINSFLVDTYIGFGIEVREMLYRQGHSRTLGESPREIPQAQVYTLGLGTKTLNETLAGIPKGIDHVFDIRNYTVNNARPYHDMRWLRDKMTDPSSPIYCKRYEWCKGLSGKDSKGTYNVPGEDNVYDYIKFAASEKFQEDFDKIRQAVARGEKVLIISSEGSPSFGPRAMLIGHKLFQEGVSVAHINVKGSTRTVVTHEEQVDNILRFRKNIKVMDGDIKNLSFTASDASFVASDDVQLQKAFVRATAADRLINENWNYGTPVRYEKTDRLNIDEVAARMADRADVIIRFKVDGVADADQLHRIDTHVGVNEINGFKTRKDKTIVVRIPGDPSDPLYQENLEKAIQRGLEDIQKVAAFKAEFFLKNGLVDENAGSDIPLTAFIYGPDEAHLLNSFSSREAQVNRSRDMNAEYDPDNRRQKGRVEYEAELDYGDDKFWSEQRRFLDSAEAGLALDRSSVSMEEIQNAMSSFVKRAFSTDVPENEFAMGSDEHRIYTTKEVITTGNTGIAQAVNLACQEHRVPSAKASTKFYRHVIDNETVKGNVVEDEAMYKNTDHLGIRHKRSQEDLVNELNIRYRNSRRQENDLISGLTDLQFLTLKKLGIDDHTILEINRLALQNDVIISSETVKDAKGNELESFSPQLSGLIAMCASNGLEGLQAVDDVDVINYSEEAVLAAEQAAQTELSVCREAGIGIITPNSAEYPVLFRTYEGREKTEDVVITGRNDFGAYTTTVKRTVKEDAPAVLYYKGDLEALTAASTIAVIGEKKSSDEAIHAARSVALAATKAGVTLVTSFNDSVSVYHENAIISRTEAEIREDYEKEDHVILEDETLYREARMKWINDEKGAPRPYRSEVERQNIIEEAVAEAAAEAENIKRGLKGRIFAAHDDSQAQATMAAIGQHGKVVVFSPNTLDYFADRDLSDSVVSNWGIVLSETPFGNTPGRAEDILRSQRMSAIVGGTAILVDGRSMANEITAAHALENAPYGKFVIKFPYNRDANEGNLELERGEGFKCSVIEAKQMEVVLSDVMAHDKPTTAVEQEEKTAVSLSEDTPMELHPSKLPFTVYRKGHEQVFLVQEIYPDVREAVREVYGADAVFVNNQRDVPSALENRVNWFGEVLRVGDGDVSGARIQDDPVYESQLFYDRGKIHSIVTAPDGYIGLVSRDARQKTRQDLDELITKCTTLQQQMQQEAEMPDTAAMSFSEALYLTVTPAGILVKEGDYVRAKIDTDKFGRLVVKDEGSMRYDYSDLSVESDAIFPPSLVGPVRNVDAVYECLSRRLLNRSEHDMNLESLGTNKEKDDFQEKVEHGWSAYSKDNLDVISNEILKALGGNAIIDTKGFTDIEAGYTESELDGIAGEKGHAVSRRADIMALLMLESAEHEKRFAALSKKEKKAEAQLEELQVERDQAHKDFSSRDSEEEANNKVAEAGIELQSIRTEKDAIRKRIVIINEDMRHLAMAKHVKLCITDQTDKKTIPVSLDGRRLVVKMKPVEGIIREAQKKLDDIVFSEKKAVEKFEKATRWETETESVQVFRQRMENMRQQQLSVSREGYARLEELISDSASENFGIIERNGKQAYVNMDSMQIIGDLHDKCLPFKDGVGCVRDNGARNIVGPDGNKLLPMDVEKLGEVSEGMMLVMVDGRANFVNLSDPDHFVSSEGFEYARPFKEGFAVVMAAPDSKNAGKYNYIRKDGTLLLKQWADLAKDFKNGHGKTVYDGHDRVVNEQGRSI